MTVPGGWTGKTRIPGIHTYDTLANKWLPAALNEPLLCGFPAGAGLSAHTATAIQGHGSRAEAFAALIIGREGSLRIQRKAGNIYLLYGNLPFADSTRPEAEYTYVEANPMLITSSRSYHTSTAINSSSLLSFGGRKDHSVEILSWAKPKSGSTKAMDWPSAIISPQTRCPLVTGLMRDFYNNQLNATRFSFGLQSSWRGHAAIPGEGGVLITAGEGFNALVRDPLDNAYLLKFHCMEMQNCLYKLNHTKNTGSDAIVEVQPEEEMYRHDPGTKILQAARGNRILEMKNKQHIQELNIGKLTNPRAYAVCAMHPRDGSAWLHGGFGPGGKTMNTLLRLVRTDGSGDEDLSSISNK